MLIHVLWCTSDEPICKAAITCPINSCQQQINSWIYESTPPKTSSGCKKPTEYWGSLITIWDTKTKNFVLNWHFKPQYTNPQSVHISNMQFNSGHHQNWHNTKPPQKQLQQHCCSDSRSNWSSNTAVVTAEATGAATQL